MSAAAVTAASASRVIALSVAAAENVRRLLPPSFVAGYRPSAVRKKIKHEQGFREKRATGLEPATSSLEGWRSTN